MFRKTPLSFESLENRHLLTVPDFLLMDVNTTSPTSGEMVSPLDFPGAVTGWYFGHST
jgi:hypothetical protein